MISAFKKLIPKRYKTLIKKLRNFNALNELDKKMCDYINYNNGFYIECGANDGIDQSNTWYFEKIKNWKGLLIEPLPELFKELKKNRSNTNIFSNTFLTSFTETKKQIYMLNDDLQSFRTNSSRNTVKVKFSTLTEVLKKNDCPNLIDFFSLDVEGSELDVINGINFDKYNFKYFLIETKKYKIIESFLIKKNYIFLKKLSKHDYLFKFEY